MTITVFNKSNHTVAELEDLVAAKDYQIASLWSAAGPHIAKIAASDVSWPNDWQGLNTRYKSAKENAEKYIKPLRFSLTPNNMIPVEPLYQAILTSLKQNPTTITPGDLQDLSNRVSALGIHADYSGTPQPRAVSNVEGLILKGAQQVLSPIDRIVQNEEDKYKNPSKHRSWWLYITLGSIAGFFALRGAKRYALPVAKAYYGPELEAARVVEKMLPHNERLQHAVTSVLHEKKEGE